MSEQSPTVNPQLIDPVFATIELEQAVDEYLTRLRMLSMCQEAVKHQELPNTANPDLSDTISSFDKNVQEIQTLLMTKMKVDCTELISKDEIEQLVEYIPRLQQLQQELTKLNKALEGVSEDNQEVVAGVKNLKRRIEKIMLDINSTTVKLVELQEKVIQGGSDRMEELIQ